MSSAAVACGVCGFQFTANGRGRRPAYLVATVYAEHPCTPNPHGPVEPKPFPTGFQVEAESDTQRADPADEYEEDEDD